MRVVRHHGAHFDRLIIVATVLGHESNLLVRPIAAGVSVTHFNNRFTANAAGVTYNAEVYRYKNTDDVTMGWLTWHVADGAMKSSAPRLMPDVGLTE
jgi:hypothetical protein